MDEITTGSVRVSLGFIRSVASWKPFTDTKGIAPALTQVAFISHGMDSVGKPILTTLVTDRYRIVMRNDSDSNVVWENNLPLNTYFNIGIDQIIKFVAATKIHKSIDGIYVDIVWDGENVSIEGSGLNLSERNLRTTFPKVLDLVNEWKINDAPLSTVAFDVTRVADFAKILSPRTGKKYSAGWKFEQGKSNSGSDKSGPYRLTNNDDNNIVALLQPNTIN